MNVGEARVSSEKFDISRVEASLWSGTGGGAARLIGANINIRYRNMTG